MKPIFLLIIAAIFFTVRVDSQQNINGVIRMNGVTRDYILHLPVNSSGSGKMPLMLIFHGGGGTAIQMQRYMQMDEIANREHFITVYPGGINKQWNDGREFKKDVSINDDILFISSLLDSLTQNYPVDTKRIFATGISNGGFFSIYLSWKLNQRFLAVAPVCANIPEKVFDQFYPPSPISLLLINGTQDPLVAYNGGEVGNRFTGARGRSVATDSTIGRFIHVDAANPSPIVENLPDLDISDDCKAIKYSYLNGRNNSSVLLIKVINGGHALPGGVQYLPKMMIGKVCRDFKAGEVIWQFFSHCLSRP